MTQLKDLIFATPHSPIPIAFSLFLIGRDCSINADGINSFMGERSSHPARRRKLWVPALDVGFTAKTQVNSREPHSRDSGILPLSVATAQFQSLG